MKAAWAKDGRLWLGNKIAFRQQDIGEVLKQVMPQDLVKFGLIPELIGRLASIVTLNALNEDMLVDILTQPKNALVKQYARLFEIDGVELNFEPEAVRAIAKKAISRKTGARTAFHYRGSAYPDYV